MLVRDYATDACRKLIANGQLQPDNTQIEKLKQVNRGLPPTGIGKPVPYSAFEFDEMRNRVAVFISMRWIRYGIGTSPGYLFSKIITSDAFLETVEEWIVDKWGVEDHPPYGSKEPRPQRFSDLPFNLSSNSHGSLPTLESLEITWSGMPCGVLPDNCLKHIPSGIRKTSTAINLPTEFHSIN